MLDAGYWMLDNLQTVEHFHISHIFSFLTFIILISFCQSILRTYFCAGEMAERSNAAVLKTVEGNTSGGSNPSLSALSLVSILFTRLFQLLG